MDVNERALDPGYKDAFERIGVSLDDLAGMDRVQKFMYLRDVFANLEDRSLASAAAMEIFGDAGGRLNPILSMGSEEFEIGCKQGEGESKGPRFAPRQRRHEAAGEPRMGIPRRARRTFCADISGKEPIQGLCDCVPHANPNQCLPTVEKAPGPATSPRSRRCLRGVRVLARWRWRTCRRAAPCSASRGMAKRVPLRACPRATSPACRTIRARLPGRLWHQRPSWS